MKKYPSITTGHKTVRGTSWPIENVIQRDDRRWLVLYGLCQGVPLSNEQFDTLEAAVEAAVIPAIDAELGRLAVIDSDVGPVDSICVAPRGRQVRVYDDHADHVGDPAEILEALRSLPDSAGWEAVWGALSSPAQEKKVRTRFEVHGDTVFIRYPEGPITDAEERAYRVVSAESNGWGYVYDITHRPGTLGSQVLDPRGPTGTTLTGPRDGERLADLLRQCLRSARGKAARNEYEDPADVRL